MKAKDRAAKTIAREERLRELYEKNGKVLTVAAVLKDARKKTSPLHDYFEWNDAVAAEKYRQEQARHLIREVRYKVEHTTHDVRVPTYVHDTRQGAETGGGYVATADLRDDKEHAREVLERRLGVTQTEIHTNHRLAQALGLSEEFDAFLSHIDRLRARIAAA